MTAHELLALVREYGYAEFDRGVELAVRHDADSERATDARKHALELLDRITVAVIELERDAQ